MRPAMPVRLFLAIAAANFGGAVYDMVDQDG
jgi:hypothetical protein